MSPAGWRARPMKFALLAGGGGGRPDPLEEAVGAAESGDAPSDAGDERRTTLI